MTKPKFECSCTNCQAACSRKPGWFLPGEIESLAEAMGVPLQRLFDERLSVDWWVDDGGDIFVLSPAIPGFEGKEFPAYPGGRCTFFKDGKCEVHDLGKPHECAMLTHESRADHGAVARAWKGHQDQIRALLGRAPVSSEFGSAFDMIRMFSVPRDKTSTEGQTRGKKS